MSITQRSKLQGARQAYMTAVTAAPAAAGTYTPNVDRGNRHIVTMPAGNITIAAPTNARLGAVLDVVIVQDGTGSRTVTWNAVFKFAGATAPTLTTTANRRDTLRFTYDGTNWNEAARAFNVG